MVLPCSTSETQWYRIVQPEHHRNWELAQCCHAQNMHTYTADDQTCIVNETRVTVECHLQRPYTAVNYQGDEWSRRECFGGLLPPDGAPGGGGRAQERREHQRPGGRQNPDGDRRQNRRHGKGGSTMGWCSVHFFDDNWLIHMCWLPDRNGAREIYPIMYALYLQYSTQASSLSICKSDKYWK